MDFLKCNLHTVEGKQNFVLEIMQAFANHLDDTILPIYKKGLPCKFVVTFTAFGITVGLESPLSEEQIEEIKSNPDYDPVEDAVNNLISSIIGSAHTTISTMDAIRFENALVCVFLTSKFKHFLSEKVGNRIK